MKYFNYTVLLLTTFLISAQDPKIVALVPGHNDARFLPNCFRALACYADAIVYLDDASDDDSVAVAQSLAQECRIEQIIVKQTWNRDEPGDRNTLLNVGRAIGGTHFIVLDTDEMFTANCQEHSKIRQHILNLKPGERLVLNWIQLWRSLDVYRFDNSIWTWNYKDFAFCDDSICCYASDFLHTSRTPRNLAGPNWFIEGYTYGVLHFQFTNWRNVIIKHAWYRCLERVKYKDRPAHEINGRYNPSLDETNIHVEPAPAYWFDYSFLDRNVYQENEQWREEQVMNWFLQYGIDRFADLDIWDIAWPFEKYLNNLPKTNSHKSQVLQDIFFDTFVFNGQENGLFVDIGAHDGIQHSNSYFFEKERNWKGLCIEPLPTVFAELQKNRTADCINGCISNNTSNALFYAVSGPSQQLSGLIDTYDPRHKERMQREIKQRGGKCEIIQVPTYRLADICSQYTITHIDFLSVDTEGNEYDILHAIDFDKLYIRAITVENNYNDNRIKELLISKGFAFITRLGNQDDVYINKNKKESR